MKQARRLFAFVAAIVMAFAVALPAWAEDGEGGETDAATYSITVNNTNQAMSINGKTYTAYKLFDVKYSGSNYSYTISTTNPFYTTEGAKAVLDEYFDFTDIASDPNTKTVTVKLAKQDADKKLSESDARKLADALQPFATGAGAGSDEASNESATITLADPGYYIVTGTVKPTDPENSDKEVVSAVILDNAAPTATVYPKASVPTLDKKITGEHLLDDDGMAATAQVGSTVSFELDSVVPDLTGYSNYTFIIKDTMTSGLTFTDPEGDANNDAVVTINDEVKTSGCTITVSGQVLTVTIPFDVLDAANTGDAIVVTYSAVLNENALTTDYDKNTANLEYSHSPYDGDTNKTPDKEVYVIDVDINVDKVAEEETGEKLSGAKFKVFKGETKPADNAEAWYKWDATNKVVTWVAKADADEFETTNGKFTTAVQGLEAENTGTKYGLLETEAPTGYNLLPNPIIVTLTGAYSESDTARSITVSAENATMNHGTVDLTSDPIEQLVATAQVINNSGTELPSTGGIGTTIFYVVGGVLVAGAAVSLVVRRRTAAE